MASSARSDKGERVPDAVRTRLSRPCIVSRKYELRDRRFRSRPTRYLIRFARVEATSLNQFPFTYFVSGPGPANNAAIDPAQPFRICVPRRRLSSFIHRRPADALCFARNTLLAYTPFDERKRWTSYAARTHAAGWQSKGAFAQLRP